MRDGLGLRDFSAKLFEAGPDRRVQDEVADPQHDAAEDLRVDLARELDLVAGLLADPLAEALDRLGVELDRARDLSPAAACWSCRRATSKSVRIRKIAGIR